MMVLVRGIRRLRVGDTVKDFRGEMVTIESIYPPGKNSSGGRVTFKGRLGHFFPSVISAKFVDDEKFSGLPDTSASDYKSRAAGEREE